MSQVANLCYSKYKPPIQAPKKRGILKKLKGNKDTVITHPDKWNDVVITDRKHYYKAMYDILEKNSKFKTEKLKTNTTLLK